MAKSKNQPPMKKNRAARKRAERRGDRIHVGCDAPKRGSPVHLPNDHGGQRSSSG